MSAISHVRTRWAAIGAALAVTLGAGGISFVSAAVSSGERTVFVPITPCRLFDTRPAFQVGPKSSPLGANEVHTVAGVGSVGECTTPAIPADAVALALNITAVDATAPTYLTVWPAGTPQPNSSSHNPAPGQPPTPNAVTTDLGAGGQFSIYNLDGTVHVLADVVGYYADHNHDDRYYQKSEVDAAIDNAVNSAPPLSKSIPLSVYSDAGLNWNTRYSDGSDSGIGGLNLDIEYNFTVPPDYTSGARIEVRYLAYAKSGTAFPCNGELDTNGVFAMRANVGQIASNPEMSPADEMFVFTQPDIPRLYVKELLPNTDLQPGDAITFAVFNFAPATRCELVVTGVSVYYS